jgi:tetratricopeptide (TPR) repeat protein
MLDLRGAVSKNSDVVASSKNGISGPGSFRRFLIFLPVIGLGCTLGLLSIRTASVAHLESANLNLAARIAPGHPEILGEQVLLAVAKATAQRKEVSGSTSELIRTLARRAPLAAEPFAIEGATALKELRYAEAQQLLTDARRRNPRSKAVRFLLADVYARQQKTIPALHELLILSDLAPEMNEPIVQMLAEFSYTRGAVSALGRALRDKPQIEGALLSRLADRPENTRLILSLASSRRGTAGLLDWQEKLLFTLVKAGELRTAAPLWLRFSGQAPGAIGNFSDSTTKSPFTWNLAESAEASARSSGQALETRFFGRADIDLASKIAVLGPGRYNLRFRVEGARGDLGTLHWRVTCLPGGNQLADVPLSQARQGRLSTNLDVSGQCEAQELKLVGLAHVYPAEVSLKIADLQIKKLS